MGNPIIEIAVSQGDQTLGSIRLELYPDKAPGLSLIHISEPTRP